MSFSSDNQSSDQTGRFDQSLSSTQNTASSAAQNTAQGQTGTATQQTKALPASPLEQELARIATQYGLTQAQMAEQLTGATAGQPVGPTGSQGAAGSAINDAYLQQLQGRAAGGNVISPQAQAEIERQYGAASQLGQRDINTSATNDAQARGMAVTDSPIANAKALALADFEARLQSAKAGATLDYGSKEADRATAFDQYQKELQQRAFNNRLALVGTNPGTYGLQNTLFNQRMAQGQTQGNTNNVLQGSTMGASQGATSNTGTQTGNSSGLFSGSGTSYGLSGRDTGGVLTGVGTALKGAGEAYESGLFG